MDHQDLPVAVGSGADPDRGNRDRFGHPLAGVDGDGLDDDRECAGGGDSFGVPDDGECGLRCTSLGAKPTKGLNSLWHEPDMRHDRNATVHQKPDRLRNLHAAFQLNGLGAGFGENTRGAAKSLLLAGFVAAKWKIHDHEG